MQITFPCPSCEQAAQTEWSPGQERLPCAQCGLQLEVPADAWDDGLLRRCLACPSHDLFVRKDFPQRLGVAIVVTGFALSSVAWYYYQPLWAFAFLFATALIDVVLYLVMGDAICCYRCGALYRGLPDIERYQSFNLETHERYRQEKIRLAESAHTSP
ncbi:MAG: hypothetical protein SGJ19_14655 [Planctomycetia bacterium]|nr:hypothetical protein [Planctomycetia bacterium]